LRNEYCQLIVIQSERGAESASRAHSSAAFWLSAPTAAAASFVPMPSLFRSLVSLISTNLLAVTNRRQFAAHVIIGALFFTAELFLSRAWKSARWE
jgi:predicted transporter